MKSFLTSFPVFLLAFAAIGCGEDTPAADPAGEAATAAVDTPRTVAITIDDLPVVGAGSLAEMQGITTRLLGHVTAEGMPAIGFVNEAKVDQVPAELDARTALLQAWLDAGLELGNHTHSHPSLFRTPLPEFQQEVLKGERITRALLAERGDSLTYFRHPYLNTGPDLATKDAFEAFLKEQGYTVAPVTIDNDEWIYAAAYRNALAEGDTALAQRIGADYIRYMEEIFVFFERLSRDLLGREPAQTLLIHANALNADYLDDLSAMMRRRGYRYVSLDKALEDSAYALPDRYTGESGISWLIRWAVTRGQERMRQPAAPAWVVEAYENP